MHNMAESDKFPLPLVIACALFFVFTFISSAIGNTWVMKHCWKTLKRKKISLMWYVLNLAFADLLFTLLTPFNVIAFLYRWVGGNITCKLQGFLVEASYTVSIATLVMISYQRLAAIADPLNARARNISGQDFRKILILWAICLVVCSPLLFLYHLELDTGLPVCDNSAWGTIGRQVFYSLHAVFSFVVPLCYMIYSQSKIFCALRAQVIVPVTLSAVESTRKRQKKIAKTLAALTTVFVFCWSPFMVIRTLMYVHLAEPDMIWKVAQLLVCLNAVLDPVMYGIYGGNLKTALCARCCCSVKQNRNQRIFSMVHSGTTNMETTQRPEAF